MRNKVQDMLFVQQVENNLIPIATELWGAGRSLDTPDMVWLYKVEDGKRVFTNFYFRYKKHVGDLINELTGFFYSEVGFGCYGTEINELNDKEYMEAVKAIKQWIPCVVKEIKDLELKDELLSLIEE